MVSLDNLKGLHPRGSSYPNIMEARRAKPLSMLYLANRGKNSEAQAMSVVGHSDPVCPRMSVKTQVSISNVYRYADDRLIAFLGVDDPLWVKLCSMCGEDRPLTRRENGWKKHAACYVRGKDMSDLFVNPGKDKHRDYEIAASLCAECPVRQECADYGARMNSEQPRRQTVIWGGELTEKGAENVRIWH